MCVISVEVSDTCSFRCIVEQNHPTKASMQTLQILVFVIKYYGNSIENMTFAKILRK